MIEHLSCLCFQADFIIQLLFGTISLCHSVGNISNIQEMPSTLLGYYKENGF